jgi:DNA topoisomerase-3
MTQVLCVAEKPSIAKAVANHLGSQARAVRLDNLLSFRLGLIADMYKENVRGIGYVKNYKFDFRFNPWGQCSVTFTCVAGHIVAQDFGERYKKWHSCQPQALFDAPIESNIAEVCELYFLIVILAKIAQNKKVVASNIEAQARYANILFIWTDCDREGEHIGTEIRDIALKANPNMQVWRARFSNIERASVLPLYHQTFRTYHL